MAITIRSADVFQADGGVVRVTAADLAPVIARGQASPRRRARLCTHASPDDSLHEMLIVLERDTYIRPHRHADKCESFHIIDGELDVVIFSPDGAISEVIRMGPYGSGQAFFYRLREPHYHTVLVRSPYALFHETTNGPFVANGTEFAPWAPAEDDPAAAEYARQLRQRTASPTRMSA
jgi:cupin fold WbuC family metalloprotein